MGDLGSCKPGAWKLVADGFSRLDNSMPTNTSGDLRCKEHPVGTKPDLRVE